MTNIASNFEKKIGYPGIIDKLTGQLSLSELNSVLLEIFRKAAHKVTPADLMKSYEQNRFVSFSQYDPIDFGEYEIDMLKSARQSGFVPVDLSPVSPLGTCSAIATVDQNKIISAARGTEVVADATNMLALECSKRRKASAFNSDIIQLCTSHKHIRGQWIGDTPGHTAHFKIFCAVTAGKDTGSFEFEKKSLSHHLHFYKKYLTDQLGFKNILIRLRDLQMKEENRLYPIASDFIESDIKSFRFERIENYPPVADQQYYQQLQFKIMLISDKNEFEIGDGGFVNWSQKLTGNKKERMLISGIGTEYLYKILKKLI